MDRAPVGESLVEAVSRKGLVVMMNLGKISVAVMSNPVREILGVTTFLLGEVPVVVMTNPGEGGVMTYLEVPVAVVTNPAAGQIPPSTHGKEYLPGKVVMAAVK